MASIKLPDGTILLNPTPKQIAEAQGSIYLENKKRQNIVSKALDIISAPFSQPGTTFTKGLGAGAAKVKSTREAIASGKKSGLPVILTTLGSTALAGGATLAAAGAAGAGAAGAAARSAAAFAGKKILTSRTVLGVAAVATLAPSTFKAFIKTPGAIPTAAAAAISPVAGLVVGLEKGTGLIKTALEKAGLSLPGIAKTAGGVAALTGAGVAGVALAPKIKDLITGGKEAAQTVIPSSVALPAVSGSLPEISTPVVSPGSVQTASSSPVIAESPPAQTAQAAAPVIKITNKPEINIAIAS